MPPPPSPASSPTPEEFAQLLISSTRVQFPPDFLFGTACADHQVEAHDPEHEDVWDLWEVCQDLIPRKQGTDFWNRYEEDIQKAADMGCRLFRFSISWARVETSPGIFDQEALDHYRRLAQTIRDQGMQVMVTLVHFVWPVHVEARGGLTAPEFPTWFEAYGEKVAEALGDLADWWITFNEPSQLVYGFTKPWWQDHYYMPPGLPSGAGSVQQAEEVGRLIHNLFSAHAKARTVIRQCFPGSRVGVNPLVTGLPPWLQCFMDWQATRCRTTQMLAHSTGRISAPLLSERGRVDLVLGGLTREEDAGVSFSDPYLFTGKAILRGPGSTARSAKDLAGEKVAIIAGTNAQDALEECIPGAIAVRFADYTLALESLETDGVEAILGDAALLRELQGQSCSQCQIIEEDLTQETWAAAVPNGHGELLELINHVVAEFKKDHWEESVKTQMQGKVEPMPSLMSLQEYIEFRKTGKKRVRQTLPVSPGPELKAILKRGWIRIGVRDDTPGFAARDKDGHSQGLEIDLARAIAEDLFGDSNKLVLEIMPPRQRLDALRSNRKWLNRAWRFYGMAAMVTNANWWYLGMAGKLPEFLCPKEAVGAMDFAGVDYYWGLPTRRLLQFKRLGDAAAGRFRDAPVWPRGLYNALKTLHQWFPDQEIIIVENGCVPEADRVTRKDYLKAHVRQVAKALRNGIKVTGYLCWSITSNREWGHPFSDHTDFGLYHVDLDHDPDLERVETSGVKTYQELIRKYME